MLWAPSMNTFAPLAWARRMISSTGFTVPVELAMWATLTILVRSVRRWSNSSRISSPLSLMGTALRRAPLSSQMSCQGTILEWCSISVMSTSSPGCRKALPKEEATRLIASVVPFGEDDLFDKGGIEKLFDLLADIVIAGGRLGGKIVDGAVDGAILLFIEAAHRLDHSPGFLRGGSGIEIDERLAVQQLMEHGKFVPDFSDIEIHLLFPRPTLVSIQESIEDPSYFFHQGITSEFFRSFRGKSQR